MVISDILLDDGDTLGTLRKIMSVTRSPVVVSSGRCDEGDRVRYHQGGINHILPKPLSFELFHDAVQRFAPVSRMQKGRLSDEPSSRVNAICPGLPEPKCTLSDFANVSKDVV